jgi:hypothetical protein
MELYEKYEIPIRNYIEWYLQDCDNQVDELEWLINLIIDSGGKQKDELIEVIEAINQGYVPDNNNKF